MKGKYAKKTNLPIGSGPQKKSSPASRSGLHPNCHNKKAKRNPKQNQKKNNHDAATSSGNQAKIALTAAQFYNRKNAIPGTSKSEMTGITTTRQEMSTVALVKQGTARFTPVLLPKLREIDSSSTGDASDSDHNFETKIKAKIEKALNSESGKNSSGIEERGAADTGDGWEDADISSEESSVKHHPSAASSTGLSNGPEALLPLFNTSSKPCSPSVEVVPSVCSSATLGLSKSPHPQVSQKSEPSKITTPTGNDTGESILLESVKFGMRQDLETSSIVQIPVWFSQKVRKILEGSNNPDNMESKDINRLTHYRAWLEGVRHRRWQRYNLADEKRTRLTDLLLKYKAEGRNMEAYKHRFLQWGIWKRDALRSFKRLEKLVKGIKLLDDSLDTILAHKGKDARKWLSIQRTAKTPEKRHSMI